MDALSHPRRALLVGGTSDIGIAVLEAVTAGRDTELILAGRDPERCRAAASRVRGRLETVRFDADDPGTHAGCVEEAWAGGEVDLVVVAHGALGDTPSEWFDARRVRSAMEVNLLSTTGVLAAAADRIRRQGHGTIVVLSSIAASRPRRANFVYGAAKAGVDAFATGLGDVLAEHGGRVLVVRPGFVRSRMTEGLPEAPFATTPDAVGEAVAAALRRGAREVWVPSHLRWVAAALRLLPHALFSRVAGNR